MAAQETAIGTESARCQEPWVTANKLFAAINGHHPDVNAKAVRALGYVRKDAGNERRDHNALQRGR
jgi:hypothetical protein